MNQNSNEIVSEIDAIIARAMAEYSQAKGVDVFSTTQPEPEPEPEEAIIDASIPDVIPTNSESILVEETTSRFSSAIWFNKIQEKQITLAGLGGIGSYVALLLARMQPSQLLLYDDDRVEAANMSGQLYDTDSIGQYKVSAISRIIQNFANYYSSTTINERFTSESIATDIMICGFDSMESRKLFFNTWYTKVKSVSVEERSKLLFIDGRLAAESFQVFCLKGDDAFNIDKYRKEWLFSDSEAEATICSYKQTTFMANMIGSVIVNLFVNFCANECDPLIPRDLPFFTEYNAETMYFKVVA